MSDGKPKVDVVVLVLLLGVMVSGFWMVGKGSGEKLEVLDGRISHVDDGIKGVSMQVAEVQNILNDMKSAPKAPAAAPAPAPAPEPAKAAPAKK